MVGVLVKNGGIPSPGEAPMDSLPGSPRGTGGSLTQSIFQSPCILPLWTEEPLPHYLESWENHLALSAQLTSSFPWLCHLKLMTKQKTHGARQKKHTSLCSRPCLCYLVSCMVLDKAPWLSEPPFYHLKGEIWYSQLIGLIEINPRPWIWNSSLNWKLWDSDFKR